jgi:hypothetical protein
LPRANATPFRKGFKLFAESREGYSTLVMMRQSPQISHSVKNPKRCRTFLIGILTRNLKVRLVANIPNIHNENLIMDTIIMMLSILKNDYCTLGVTIIPNQIPCEYDKSYLPGAVRNLMLPKLISNVYLPDGAFSANLIVIVVELDMFGCRVN